MRSYLLLLLALTLLGCPQAQPGPSESPVPAATSSVASSESWTLRGVKMLDGRTVNLGVESGRFVSIDDTEVGRVLEGQGLTAVPGFIDAHVHLGFYQPRQVVEGGLTTVRDLGWLLEASREWVKASSQPDWGPAVLAVGPMVTVTGGYPSRAGWAPNGTAVTYSPYLVARLAGEGVCAIKVTLQPGSGPTLSLEQLKEIVAKAHEENLLVTAHVSGLPELEKALEAGVDELAHFVFDDSRVSKEQLARMVEQGVTVIPTLRINPSPSRLANLSDFVKAGGKVVFGTDMGNGGGPGIDVRELQLMEQAGMSPDQVLHSATAGAAEHLGLTDRGRLEVGAGADFLLVNGDPRTDWTLLKVPVLVVRDGVIVLNRLSN